MSKAGMAFGNKSNRNGFKNEKNEQQDDKQEIQESNTTFKSGEETIWCNFGGILVGSKLLSYNIKKGKVLCTEDATVRVEPSSEE